MSLGTIKLGAAHDIVIVGAGIAGTWLAVLLSRAFPEREIVLLEQSTTGSGASNVSAGFDAIESPDSMHRALAYRSRCLYQELSVRVPMARTARLRTYWIVHAVDASQFRKNFLHPDHPVRLERLDASHMPEGFHIPGDSALFREDESGYAHPGEFCRAALRDLTASHDCVRVYEGTRVVKVLRQGSLHSFVASDGRHIRATLALIATGAFPRIPPTGRVAGLRRKKVSSMVINVRPTPSAAAVVYPSLGCFFLPVVDAGHWKFSFTVNAWDVPWSGLPSLTSAERQSGINLLGSLKPDFVEYAGGSQVAYDLYTTDMRPIAVQLTRGLWFIGGFSGGGFRWAPAFIERHLDEIVSEILQ